MADGYAKVYKNIDVQQRQIAEQQEQLSRDERFVGTTKQRLAARQPITQTRSPHQIAKEKQEYLSAKKEHLKTLGETESELGDYETKIRGYEKEGYDVSVSDEGYQFTKYIPGKRVRIGTKPLSVKVTWMEKGGIVHSDVHAKSYSSFKKRLDREFPGATITKVTTVGGGALYKTEAGHWSTKDIVLAETKPIYTQTKGEIDVDKFKLENPQLEFLLSHAEFGQAEKLGRAIVSNKPEILKNIEFQIATQKAQESFTPSEKISYAEQFYTFGEEKKLWRDVKEPGWELQIGESGKDVYYILSKPSKILV